MSQPAIVLEGLSRRFGKKLAVDGLSFQVEVGRVCGFLGRNGAGKTTTIRMLVNLMRPSAGEPPYWDLTRGASPSNSCGGWVTSARRPRCTAG